ncbi:MAG: arginine--tRNA ligase [Candidatus Anammoxibacter sp.]
MNPFIKNITTFIIESAKSEFRTELPGEQVEGLLEVPPDPAMGDYALPCFALAKQIKKSPKIVAETLAQKFVADEYVQSVVTSGPYLNFFVTQKKFIETVLNNVINEKDRFGKSQDGKGKTIVVDYSSPNIAKHLAVHHMRSALIGRAIYNLYLAQGYKCVGINHLGDWGTQFGKLIVAYKKWGDDGRGKPLNGLPINIDTLYKLYVKFHQESEKDGSLEDGAREWFKKLENGDGEAKEIWQLFKDISMKEFEKIYKMLGIKFDFYTGESFYNDMLDDTVNRIKESGLLELSENAQVVNLDKYDMPPCLIRKKDDASLYATRDICAAEYRKKEFGFDKMAYVVGSEQKLHFRQFKKVLELMGNDWVNDCSHVDFGLVKFKDEKMSTRHGKVILLEDLLNEAISRARAIIDKKNPDLEERAEVANAVGIGAIVFSDLKNKRIKDVNFVWDDILNFDGETGPYVQYTHARLCSVIRKYGKEVRTDADLSLLNGAEDFALVKRLEQLPPVIKRAAEAFEPSILINYLLEVCSTANYYYNQCRIISDDSPLTDARVALVDCVRQVINNGLLIIGMETPERM